MVGRLSPDSGVAVGLALVERDGEGHARRVSLYRDPRRERHHSVVLRGHYVHAVQRCGLVGVAVHILVLSGHEEVGAQGIAAFQGVHFRCQSCHTDLVICVDGLCAGYVQPLVEHGVGRGILNVGDMAGQVHGRAAVGGHVLLDRGEGGVGRLGDGHRGGHVARRGEHQFDGAVEICRIVPLAHLRCHEPERRVQLGAAGQKGK